MSSYICVGKDAQGKAIYRPWVITFAPCANSNDLQGVYRPEPVEQVQRKMRSRTERFLAANGIGSYLEKMVHFRGDHFLDNGYPPLTGAFGEKL